MVSRLCRYRIMWLQVIFDLPVGTKGQRRAASKFRFSLLDRGFEMEQFSVYLRCCPDKSFAERIMKQLEGDLPDSGSVKMLLFTDKQYENIRSYSGTISGKKRENPGQLQLF